MTLIQRRAWPKVLAAWCIGVATAIAAAIALCSLLLSALWRVSSDTGGSDTRWQKAQWTGATRNWRESVARPLDGWGFIMSPDGASATTVVSLGAQRQTGTMIEVREIQSGSVIATYAVPNTTENNGVPGTWAEYCDNGKYLVVSTAGGRYFVLETATYRLHFAVDLGAIAPWPAPSGEPTPDSVRTSAQSACAANGNVAVFYLARGDSRAARAFDLDAGKPIPGASQIAGVAERFGQRDPSGMAVSPSGSSMAMVSWGSVLVVDLRTRPISRIASFFDSAIPKENASIAFAGESAVAVTSYYKDYKPVIRFFDIRTGAQVQAFANSSSGAYGNFAMSADGHTVLGYAEERKAAYGQGPHEPCREAETISRMAHFTLWDRDSGKIVAQSPSLKLVHHVQRIGWGCGWESYEGPNLAINQNGKVVTAVWDSSEEEPSTPVQIFRLE